MNTLKEEPIDEVGIGNEDDTRPADKPENRTRVQGKVDCNMERHIGKYQVTRRIGSGGMAEVYEVLSQGPGGFTKRLCIKKIRKEVSARQDFVAMFETEARIVSRLQHSNIVQVFEFNRDETTGDLYLVMEYVDGLDLNTVLKEASDLGLQMPLDFAVYVLESLLSALQYAHSLKTKNEPTPVIHRDISPHNLLITTEGVVKLADFGIAKMKGMSDATETGVLKGKLAYMSPEQASGGRVPITTASDLFSSGVVFWETVTCERLFNATMQEDILIKVLNFNDASLPYYSPQFNQFLSGLLAHNPMDRFSSAEAALRALRKIGISPCRKQDAAYLVQRMKILREEAEARMIREVERAKETHTATASASSPDTVQNPNAVRSESNAASRPWKRVVAGVVAAASICATGVCMLAFPKQNTPMEEAAAVESPDAKPAVEKKSEAQPVKAKPALPESTKPIAPMIRPAAELTMETKPEAASIGASEEPKGRTPTLEEETAPASAATMNKAESAERKSRPKPKSSDNKIENNLSAPTGQDFPLEKIEE